MRVCCQWLVFLLSATIAGGCAEQEGYDGDGRVLNGRRADAQSDSVLALGPSRPADDVLAILQRDSTRPTDAAIAAADGCDGACSGRLHDQDNDGDPAVEAGGHDCDDHDPNRSSLLAEVCNGIDDNCDGRVDEGVLNACGTCDAVCRRVLTGSMGGAPFDPARQHGVEFDPVQMGLLVRGRAASGDYLWIPNTAESTVSKWDATTATELGRYRVGLAVGQCMGACCHQFGCNMASRTVVDGVGDAYVASRGFAMQGTVTKVAAERRDCVDRNGNGVIDTSTGPRDVRPYGTDECVLWTTPVGPVNALLRALAIDRGDGNTPGGYPWVGSCGGSSSEVWKLNPRTGAVIQTLSTPPGWGCSYGAVGLSDGSVWFHRYAGFGGGLLRLDTQTGTFGPIRTNTAPSRCNGTYGITADARNRLWLSGIECNTVPGYDTASNSWTEADIGSTTGLGITVDSLGNVWTRSYPSGGTLYRFSSDAFVANGTIARAQVAQIATNQRWTQASAIGSDRGGNIWLTASDPNTVLTRYTPATGRFQDFAGPNRVYTYTDFTGAVRRAVIGTGSYTQDYDTTCERPVLGELSWDAITPAGTSLAFSVQSAPSAAEIAANPATVVARAPGDRAPVALAPRVINPRRFVRLTIAFNTSLMPLTTPVLRGFALGWSCSDRTQ